MSKPMTVARYAKEHRGWFYGCLFLFALGRFLLPESDLRYDGLRC